MTKRSGKHKRRTSAMCSSPRCGAKTRAGTPCRASATSGKARCRMHGGANGSGARKGNQNALKQGMYTGDELAFSKELTKLLRASRQTLNEFE